MIFTLDLFEREILPELAIELADMFRLDPGVVHAGLEERWHDFRASLERPLERASAMSDGIGEPVGRA
jgi:hypothetical protein